MSRFLTKNKNGTYIEEIECIDSILNLKEALHCKYCNKVIIEYSEVDEYNYCKSCKKKEGYKKSKRILIQKMLNQAKKLKEKNI